MVIDKINVHHVATVHHNQMRDTCSHHSIFVYHNNMFNVPVIGILLNEYDIDVGGFANMRI